MLSLYFSSLPLIKNIGMVLTTSSLTTFMLGNNTGILMGLSMKDIVYLLI